MVQDGHNSGGSWKTAIDCDEEVFHQLPRLTPTETENGGRLRKQLPPVSDWQLSSSPKNLDICRGGSQFQSHLLRHCGLNSSPQLCGANCNWREEKRWRGPQQWRSIFNKLTPRPNTMSWTSLTGKNLTISWTGWAHARIGSGGQGCPIDRVALLHIHMLLTSTTDWLEWTHRCKARRCDQTWCSSNTSPWKNWNFKWMAFRVSFAAGNRGGWRWGPPSLI